MHVRKLLLVVPRLDLGLGLGLGLRLGLASQSGDHLLLLQRPEAEGGREAEVEAAQVALAETVGPGSLIDDVSSRTYYTMPGRCEPTSILTMAILTMPGRYEPTWGQEVEGYTYYGYTYYGYTYYGYTYCAW